MKTLLKVVSPAIILYLLYITFVLGWLGERKHLISPYIDTYFATDYLPEEFDKIKISMSLNEVESIIGKPLYISKSPIYYQGKSDSTKKQYSYTGDGKLLGKMQEQGKRYYYDCAWYCSSVILDTNNVVVEINKGWIYD